MIYEEFIKRYTFNIETDHLGEGGFGEVFKAYDNYLDKWVAIKQSKVKKGMENFTLQKEVELASQLPDHPNIAHYDKCFRYTIPMMGTFDFGILQYYEEGNLSHLRKTGKVNKQNMDGIIEGILNGLSHLHRHNIIHRDIKPANVLIVKRGLKFIPKITDFGISKQGTATDNSFISNSLAGGTFSYAAPEQLKGQAKMRRNADLWSFGVILYELMTNKLPFEATTLDKSSEAARNEVTSLILDGKLPNDIQQIPLPYQEMIELCLVVDYMQRVQKADELFDILKGKDISPKTVKKETTIEVEEFPSEKKNPEVLEPKPTEEVPVKSEPKPTEDIPVEANSEQIEFDKTIVGHKSEDVNEVGQEDIGNKTKVEIPVSLEENKEEEEEEEVRSEEAQPIAPPLPTSSAEKIIKKKKSKTLPIVIISLLSIVIIAVLYFVVFNAENSDWKNAQQSNNISSYQNYIKQYPDGKNTAQAIESIDWLNTEKESSQIAFQNFINQHPNGEFTENAKNKLENIAYQRSLNENTPNSIRSFIKEYPNSKHASDYKQKLDTWINDSTKKAEQFAVDTKAWEKAESQNTKEAYRAYMTQYPNGNFFAIAKNSINSFDLPPFEMILVEGGSFLMGSNKTGVFQKDQPIHKISLDDFYIGKYEVTQRQWKAIMGNNPSLFKINNRPVEQVSWNDVQKFIQKLNKKTGKKYRLPTEAEWEYAARGGNKSKDYKYSGSNDPAKVAWYFTDNNQTHKVGTKSTNELKIHDMSGNVSEWCQDWYGQDYYKNSPSHNPKGPASGKDKVIRGGAYEFIESPCECTNRSQSHGGPTYSRRFVGFRLVLDK